MNDLEINWRLFYTRSGFVHHFKSIGEFKLELQSENVQFGSKLAIFIGFIVCRMLSHFMYFVRNNDINVCNQSINQPM